MLMCTLGILNVLIVVLYLLSPIDTQRVVVTFYNLFSIEVYRSIIGSKKPYIVALIDLLNVLDISTKSMKDAVKVLYLLNCIILVELDIMPPLFTLVMKDE